VADPIQHMADIPISSLPSAPGLSGTEDVPIVQGGVTKRTTTGAIATVGVGAEFVLVSSNPLLPNSRVLAGASGEITLADGGAGENLTVGLAASGASPGTYGDSTHTVTATVDDTGRITSISAVAIAHQGTVTSVGLSAPVQFSVSGSPVTGSGTLTFDWADASPNVFLAGPASGNAGAPAFRAIVEADLPPSGVTAGTYGDGTHVGQFTVDATGRLTSATEVAIAHQGDVTSVGLSLPAEFTVTGSPVTSSGTLTATWANGTTGSGPVVLAGGSAIDLTNATGLPLTTGVTGTLPVVNGGTGVATATANEVFAGPASGSAAAPGMRALVLADLPVIPTVSVATRTALAAVPSSIGTAYLTETGRGGLFQWSSADQSALVTADTLQGVCVPPSSDPTGASGAWIRPEYTQRQWINFSWTGSLPNGSDTTAAFAVCVALFALTPGSHGGTLYLGPGFWKGNWQLLATGALNITVEGISFDVNVGTVLEAFDSSKPALQIGNTGSAGTYYLYCAFRNLFISSQGTAGVVALDCYQAAGILFENVSTYGGWRCVGSAGVVLLNCYGYGNGLGDPALQFTNLSGTRENNGPIKVTGGEFAVQGAGHTGKALVISEDSLSLCFECVQLYGVDGPVQIDGGSNADGSVSFIECHTESAYNATDTAAVFLIGSAAKYGSIKIVGGNYWGQGNGTLYLQDFVRVVNANNVTVDSAIASSIGQTGFSRSGIRLESTFTGKLDVRNFSYSGSGSMYSDARTSNAIPSGYVGDVSNNNQWWNGVTSGAGYTQLPGGMQMCWGTATVGASYTAVTFPRAFSSTTELIVTATPLGASANSATSPVTSISTTGFASASNSATTITWMAIGPANP